MRPVVISQPMFFPWVGFFEQMRLAEIYVYLDDVQLPQGRSFMNRVQIKTLHGMQWLTMPINRSSSKVRINQVTIDESTNWRRKHLQSLKQSYAGAVFKKNMLDLVSSVYEKPFKSLVDLNMYSHTLVLEYFGLNKGKQVLRSSTLPVSGSKTERLIEIVKHLKGDLYITGHGALRYLDHNAFERENIRVEYMNYLKLSYPQLHGAFTPYVSVLDLIANVGPSGVDYICSAGQFWRDFTRDFYEQN
ncbi:MAG: WbqC family protein [Deltaproteobacteria bacterium]|nr:WbqC family protein [Deltaproteobacteria bacterium]